MDYQFHEAAEIFPLMTGDDFDELVADIRKRGLFETIKLLDGKIIDGRNRYRACLLAKCSPRCEEVFPDDPVAYVVSLNLHRRHLTPTQLALVGARIKDFYTQQAKQRQRLSQGRGEKGPVNLPDLSGEAREKAGEAVGVSGKSIDFGTRVLNSGNPELIAAVDSDRIAVSTAARLASRTPEEVHETLARTKKGKRRKRPVEDEEAIAATDSNGEHKEKGVGIIRATEAISALKRIPVKDPLRKRAFQMVADFIKANK